MKKNELKFEGLLCARHFIYVCLLQVIEVNRYVQTSQREPAGFESKKEKNYVNVINHWNNSEYLFFIFSTEGTDNLVPLCSIWQMFVE